MGLAKVGGVDRGQGFSQRRVQFFSVHQRGDFVQDVALGCHVGCSIHRTCEHKFPCECSALAFEEIQFERAGVFDDANNFSLGPDEFGHDGPIDVCVAEIGDEVHGGEIQGTELGGKVVPVIDDVLSTHGGDPFLCLRARRGGDNNEVREPRQLDGDGTDAAGTADDEQGLPVVGAVAVNVEAVKKSFPGGNGGKRQRRCFGEGQGAGLVPDDSLIHELELRV